MVTEGRILYNIIFHIVQCNPDRFLRINVESMRAITRHTRENLPISAGAAAGVLTILYFIKRVQCGYINYYTIIMDISLEILFDLQYHEFGLCYILDLVMGDVHYNFFFLFIKKIDITNTKSRVLDYIKLELIRSS